MTTEPAKLRGAIVGCGFFGQIQMEAWRRMDDVAIVAAADPDVDRARSFADRAFPSLDELLAQEQNLDFVDIATRPESHLDLVRVAARHGVAAICQKPMAPTWDEAVAMAQAAREGGIRLLIHENWRWQPWYREVKKLLDSGAIGTPLFYRFRMRKRDGLGPECYPAQPYFRQMPRLLIYETIVHAIDTARFLFGEIESVYAEARRVNPLIAGEDLAVLVLRHQEELNGLIDGHRFTGPDTPPLGDAEIEGLNGGTIIVAQSGDVLLNQEMAWKNQIREGYRGDSVRATQRHIVDCLRSGAFCESEADEYLKTVGVVEAAYKSIAEDKSIRI